MSSSQFPRLFTRGISHPDFGWARWQSDGDSARPSWSVCTGLSYPAPDRHSISKQSTGFNFAGLMVARVGLGAFEAGFAPGTPVYMVRRPPSNYPSFHLRKLMSTMLSLVLILRASTDRSFVDCQYSYRTNHQLCSIARMKWASEWPTGSALLRSLAHLGALSVCFSLSDYQGG
jgi:hypothetical protein